MHGDNQTTYIQLLPPQLDIYVKMGEVCEGYSKTNEAG